jgi:serine/threonine protein kinase
MPTPNQRLGEYVLMDRIGQGAIGEVWLHHAWVEKIVAVKIPSDPQYVRSLQKEGHAAHRLSHPNIVKAIAFDPFADPPYFVMEFIPGTSLRTLIQRGPMEPKHAVAVLRQGLAALHHAHNHGMIHRDIEPENILIHPARLADR